MSKTPNEIPLTKAAHTLGIDYGSARSLAIVGRIEARQTVTGRWMCDVASVERLRSELHAVPARRTA